MIQSTITNPNILSISPEFRRSCVNGNKLASSALPYLELRGLWDIMDNIKGRNIPDVAKQVATIMLCMPNTINGLPEHTGNIDPSIYCVLHENIANLMESSEGIDFRRTQLIQSCVQFCKENGLVVSGDDLQILEEQVYADVNGVWHELNWENLLLCADIPVEHANRAEDLSGTDLWVDIDDDVVVGVDVKTTLEGAYRHAKKKGLEISQTFSYCADPSDPRDSFTVSVLADTTGEKVYVVMDNLPSSSGISPIDFRGMTTEIDTMKLAIEHLKGLCVDGPDALRLHQKIKTKTGVVHKSIDRRKL